MKLFNSKNKIFSNVFLKSLITLFLIPSLTFSTLFIIPQKAQAQGAVPVAEFPTSPVFTNAAQTIAKEGILGVGLDTLAWNIAKLLINQMTRSLVEWINSGFQGSPAFITDPESFFADIADQVVGEFIEGSALGFLCSPFQIEIKRALLINQRNFRDNGRLSCTLSSVLNNIENFDDFVSIRDTSGLDTNSVYAGGWEDWYDVAATPQGNIYGAYEAARAELAIEISSRSFNFEKELDWGSGFLSYRDCSGVPPPERRGDQSNCPIVTPGKVIEDQLSNVLGSGVRQLEIADEFNEIINALLGQLLTQAFGGQGGLFGLTRPNSDFGGDSYIDRLSEEGGNISGSRDLSNQGINRNIDVIEEYIRIKNQSIGLVNASISLQQSIISCYNQKPGAPNASGNKNLAQSRIDNVLEPIIEELEKDVRDANRNINKLEEIRTELRALANDDLEGLQDLQVKYLQFLANAQIDYLVQTAIFERDYSIPQDLDGINSSSQTILQSCLRFNEDGTGGPGPDRDGGGGGRN